MSDVTVLELAGIGPAPFAAMLLADMGARVIRVDRVGPASTDYVPNPVLERGRRSVSLDLKDPVGVELLLALAARSDVLVESYRPGVAERLGIGPLPCLEANPALVYARMSGWGQDGPLAHEAGHDINYISLTGALDSIGRADGPPQPPLNLVGDFGGGAMFLLYGITCALLEARRTGHGQVVDANVLDGTTALMAMIHGLRTAGVWSDRRGTNLLDTGCPYYDVYRCADGRYVAVGTIERKFFLNLLDVLGLADDAELAASHRDRSRWPRLRAVLARAFASRSRDEWAARFAGRDACVTPVLDLREAPESAQAVARRLYSEVPGYRGAVQPAPSPRFARDPSAVPVPPPVPGLAPLPGEHTREILADLGLDEDRIAELKKRGVVS